MALSLSVNCQILKKYVLPTNREDLSEWTCWDAVSGTFPQRFLYLVKHGQAGSTAGAPLPPLLAKIP